MYLSTPQVGPLLGLRDPDPGQNIIVRPFKLSLFKYININKVFYFNYNFFNTVIQYKQIGGILRTI